MKTKISLFFALLFAVIMIGCNSDSDNNSTNGGVNPIIGTWKLTQVYVNEAPIALTDCEQMESYLFGPEQFTHELYQSGGRGTSKTITSHRDHDDDGDDDDDDDHHHDGDDDDDDDDNNNNGGGNTGGDGGDNGSSNTCVVSSTVLGVWANPSGANYVFTTSGQADTKAIYFGADLNTFYYVDTVNVNGVTTVGKYVYQRQ